MTVYREAGEAGYAKMVRRGSGGVLTIAALAGISVGVDDIFPCLYLMKCHRLDSSYSISVECIGGLMFAPSFKRLNDDWNAEPNATALKVICNDSTLTLAYSLNSLIYQAGKEEIEHLTFEQCSIWRHGVTNDEGWFRGRCRYSKIADEGGCKLFGHDDLYLRVFTG